MERKIDINTWNRKEIYNFFSNVSNPFYMVTYKLDVTNLYNFAKTNDISFYYSLTYLVSKALNTVEAFRYTIRDDGVYLLDLKRPSFTDIKKDSELFYIVTMDDLGKNIIDFCNKAKDRSDKQNCFIVNEKEGDDLIYISCLPTINLTALTNERDLADVHAKDDSNAHISWGKYIEINGRKELGLSVEVNHRLIDGVHIARFNDELEKLINEL